MHNAGWYCVCPEEFGILSREPVLADVDDFVSDVMIHEGRVKDLKVDPEDAKEFLRSPDNKCSEEIHRQQILSLVWRSTGVDEFRITSILEALILWLHVLGLFGNLHWSAKDINSKACQG